MSRRKLIMTNNSQWRWLSLVIIIQKGDRACTQTGDTAYQTKCSAGHRSLPYPHQAVADFWQPSFGLCIHVIGLLSCDLSTAIVETGREKVYCIAGNVCRQPSNFSDCK